MKPEEISVVPENPGCYLYKDKENKVIYVGKAKNLKKRISNYFVNQDLNSKTRALVKNIFDIDFIVTNSEVEALLLENNLIKKFHPKYNINLRDSKSYSIIELTREEFPRLVSSRSEKIKSKKITSTIFGPFPSGKTRDYILETLNKTFKLRTCKHLPKNKCIRYDLGLCSAPCIRKVSNEDYLENIEKAKLVLKGKNFELIKKLKEKMADYSKNKNYEKALLIREEINAVEELSKKQSVERLKNYDEDVLNYLLANEKVYLVLFNLHNGNLENKQSFEFDFKE